MNIWKTTDLRYLLSTNNYGFGVAKGFLWSVDKVDSMKCYKLSSENRNKKKPKIILKKSLWVL
jgi:hypothetical protein